MNDSVLEELHAIRERLLAEAGGTLAGLVARLQKEQSESGRQLWQPRRTSDSTEVDGRIAERNGQLDPQSSGVKDRVCSSQVD